jgi:hypothetical protein
LERIAIPLWIDGYPMTATANINGVVAASGSINFNSPSKRDTFWHLAPRLLRFIFPPFNALGCAFDGRAACIIKEFGSLASLSPLTAFGFEKRPLSMKGHATSVHGQDEHLVADLGVSFSVERFAALRRREFFVFG